MAKFSGVIAFATSVEVTPGVWDDQIVERHYRGDILQNTRRWDIITRQSGQQINDDFKVSNLISVLADTYCYHNIPNIKYITWLGVKWKVTKADVDRPRIIFTIGDVYNATPVGVP